MSTLRVRPLPESITNDITQLHRVTPQSAGWHYVGFEMFQLKAGALLDAEGDSDEVCVVLLSGTGQLVSGMADSGIVEGRSSVFDHTPPTALYAPMHARWSVQAVTDCEIAVCKAPGITGAHPARIILPSDMSLEVRGSGTNTRHVCNILPETEPADSLLVVEVITPSGNWSSYPPHKHDRDNLPHESYLEETYFHKLNPPQGYVHQRVYTDDRSLDETVSAEDGDVVLVPKGYHPVGVPHGYESYYLNVMAGPKRVWKFYNDPNHEWMLR